MSIISSSGSLKIVADHLVHYRKRRNFRKTPEPKGKTRAKKEESLFVIQKHWARSTHFDFRLEINGVLKSWAVPKGVPKKIGEKHLAVMTEDHPLEYANFEGEIPAGEYGAGKVKIWDRGTYCNVKEELISTSLKKKVIEVELKGEKLKGSYALVHFKDKNWLLIKVRKKR